MRRARPLSTAELVEAAILADVSVLLIVVGWFLPASGVFWAAAVAPFAAIVVRHRVRALVVGACAGASVGSLALGFGMVFQVGAAALAGFIVGTALRRRWGVLRTAGLALAMGWTAASGVIVALLSIFRSSRKLTLEQLRLQWTGAKRIAHQLVPRGNDLVARAHSDFALAVVAAEVLPVAAGVALARSRVRVQRVLLVIVAAAYTAACSVLDVWAGALVAASLFVGVVSARRFRYVGAGQVIVRTWAALAAVTVAAGAAGGRAVFISALDTQWRFVRTTATVWIGALTRNGDTIVSWFLLHWWLAIPLSLVIPVVGATVVARAIAIPVLARVDRAVRRPRPATPAPGADEPGPVPVRLDDVTFRYPGADANALDGASIEIGAGSYVGVLGDNGSGKTTLARVLAGAPPASGRVERPGAAAPGARGGVAIIFQRPESQVLGVRVGEDVIWGLPDGVTPDVGGVLASVGLDGFEDRETSTLSGGELQRLAIAAALARDPGLIVSDESTAMVDPRGRAEIVALFRTIADGGVTVVHITHRPEELAAADVVYVLGGGRVVSHGEPSVVVAEA